MIIFGILVRFLLAFAISLFPTVDATSGCCSHHGGVAYCDTTTGRQVCVDGSYSPSCTCTYIPVCYKPDSIDSYYISIEPEINSTACDVANINVEWPTYDAQKFRISLDQSANSTPKLEIKSGTYRFPNVKLVATYFHIMQGNSCGWSGVTNVAVPMPSGATPIIETTSHLSVENSDEVIVEYQSECARSLYYLDRNNKKVNLTGPNGTFILPTSMSSITIFASNYKGSSNSTVSLDITPIPTTIAPIEKVVTSSTTNSIPPETKSSENSDESSYIGFILLLLLGTALWKHKSKSENLTDEEQSTTHCPSCSVKLRLNKAEIKTGIVICPQCKNDFTLKKVRSKPRAELITCISCGVKLRLNSTERTLGKIICPNCGHET